MQIRKIRIETRPDGHAGRFQALGSPCEVLTEGISAEDARELTKCAATEAWRIEDKYSRYAKGNIVDRINSACGQAIDVDEETAQLLDFSVSLHRLSAGAFDITSGVLRRAWTFDGSDNVPSAEQVLALLSLVGWNKCDWQSPTLRLPAGMEIDLGGLGKEYAVDRAVLLLRALGSTPCLVNFGGDLAVTGPPAKRRAWGVGIEAIDQQSPGNVIELRNGAIATSGDARRYLLSDGIRYGHVLDPRTGWPVIDAPRSITVAGDTCTQAGMIATLAMLQGRKAEEFLESQAEQYWCRRSDDGQGSIEGHELK